MTPTATVSAHISDRHHRHTSSHISLVRQKANFLSSSRNKNLASWSWLKFALMSTQHDLGKCLKTTHLLQPGQAGPSFTMSANKLDISLARHRLNLPGRRAKSKRTTREAQQNQNTPGLAGPTPREFPLSIYTYLDRSSPSGAGRIAARVLHREAAAKPSG